MPKKTSGYKSVNVPDYLVTELDNFLSKHKEWSSREGFIKSLLLNSNVFLDREFQETMSQIDVVLLDDILAYAKKLKRGGK